MQGIIGTDQTAYAALVFGLLLGKPTVMNMLLRLYDPQDGKIMVGGVPLSRIKRQEWLSRVGIPSQDIDLMAGTIAQTFGSDA